ncbi:MAG: RNA polymerase-binding protein DksA [Proteobacteria bacterium]|nr:RNA polymerase-binding protein DksA [Pseudomonadota bacterium]MBU1697849.1 RNA polymerase-binding protein DksA [Pseudomonadota bacterium]
MDEKQIEFFRNVLNNSLDKLLNQADMVVSELVSQSGQEIEYLDRASAYADQSLKLKIRTRESRLIKKLKQALERIENGTYGFCEECEEEISIKRLEARPVTTKCIDCKENEEQIEVSTEDFSDNF